MQLVFNTFLSLYGHHLSQHQSGANAIYLDQENSKHLMISMHIPTFGNNYCGRNGIDFFSNWNA